MNGRLLDDATGLVELSPDGDPSDFIIADGAPLEGFGGGVQAAASGAGTGLVVGAVIPHQWYTPPSAIRRRRITGRGAGRQAAPSGSGQGYVSDDELALLLLIA